MVFVNWTHVNGGSAEVGDVGGLFGNIVACRFACKSNPGGIVIVPCACKNYKF